MRRYLTIWLLLLSSLLQGARAGTPPTRIVVSADGRGDFRSIQAALNSLPDSAAAPREIFIRKGVYNEKLYIEKHNIVLVGEDREKTLIIQSIARDQWRCGHADDWGVATVNVDGNDITLKNLTITNSFGFDFQVGQTVPCPADTLTGQKQLSKSGHQMALRTLNATRLRAINCHFRAFGGDTVSPWNVANGLFYFKDCIMEGGVDFYCPRGWAWAENCRFIAHSGTAAIWHDGSRHPDAKTVLKNCTFEGFDGFRLGRFHRDAQFFLLDCTFSANMADQDIYQAASSPGIRWGRRVYYHNCHRTGGDYAWHADNLQAAAGAPRPEAITPAWLFGPRWPSVLQEGPAPRAHVRLRRKGANGRYGPALERETMPHGLPANDFATNPVPRYQTEGPAWENDKVGFRLYFDVRNAKDIFGKITPGQVMDTVGSTGDSFYHHLDPRWGMDLLKVGTSLGAGGLALEIRRKGGSDTLVRLGGPEVGETRFELLQDGPEEAIFRLHYQDWRVLGRTYQLTEEVRIRTGTYFYESRVSVTGLRGDERLVTGIVNLKAPKAYRLGSPQHALLYTHDRQTENNDLMGLAVLVHRADDPRFGATPPSGGARGITDTHTVSLRLQEGRPVHFRFYAAWEGTDPRFRGQSYFEQFLKAEAAGWHPSNIKP